MPSRSTGATKLPRSIGWTCAYRKISRGWPSEKRKELREPPKLLELDRDANEKVKRVRDMTHCQDVVCVSVLGTGIFGNAGGDGLLMGRRAGLLDFGGGFG